ncbi:hypothetical protein D1Z84_24100 [Escherichia coli]|nr:hypothetical protein [Salmonella enterica]EFN8050750.1 hypothetical protein [Escherichia coli]OSM83997.1 hypothetical protein L317_23085 [Escherichia coli SHECO003]EAP8322588.1 hypothetical protein [Salmonella enterica]EAU5838874.1 hypothetical protein [Salmonella enterica]
MSEEAEFLRCDIRISTHEYYIYFNKLKLTRDKFMVLKIEIHKASNIFYDFKLLKVMSFND